MPATPSSHLAPSIRAGELADRLGGACLGNAERAATGVGSIEQAGAADVSFVTARRHARAWSTARAGVTLFAAAIPAPSAEAIGDRAVIVVPDAELAMAEVLAFFERAPWQPPPGVASGAAVDPAAIIDPTACIGPGCVIGPGARVAAQVVLHANVFIGADVLIGAHTAIHAGAALRDRTVVGERVLIHPNVTIGADGFGYRPAPDGRRLVKMPHIGRVVIEDEVEIGACSCIDRGKFGDTRIGWGTKIDNLVQIAHNCVIGRCCVIAGTTGIGGSAVLGDGVQVGGGVRIVDHSTVGPGARLAGATVAIGDVPAGATWSGHPGGPHRSTLRQWSALRKLPGLLARRLEGRSGSSETDSPRGTARPGPDDCHEDRPQASSGGAPEGASTRSPDGASSND